MAQVPYALLLASLLVFGFFPRLLTDKIGPVTEQIVNMATAKAGEVSNQQAMDDFDVRPHPAPLPRERDELFLPQAESSVATASAALERSNGGTTQSPLPGGEGRGEGGRVVKVQKDQSLLPLSQGSGVRSTMVFAEESPIAISR